MDRHRQDSNVCDLAVRLSRWKTLAKFKLYLLVLPCLPFPLPEDLRETYFSLFQAQFIAQSIGQAFQVAYMEFLKANGIEDHSFVKEMDYQEVLNSQEIYGDELQMFAKKELQKEVSG